MRRAFSPPRASRAAEDLKVLFEAHGGRCRPTEIADTARFALGASVYQLAPLHRHEHARCSEPNRGLEAFLRAA